MKKIYKSLFMLALVAGFTTANAQTDAQLATPMTDAEVSQKLEGLQIATIKPQAGDKATCTNVVNCPATGGNSFDGNMFDITATNTVTIETFSVVIDASATVEIYARTGSFVGNESSSAGWTMVGSGVVAGLGVAGGPVEVPTDIAYTMNAGTTHAFYVTINVSQATPFNYTNGTTVGATWASDANITVKEGNGGAYPFSVTFSPRNFNGDVIYCLPTGVEEKLSTNNVSVYPNPAKNEMNVDLSALNGQTANIAIYNVLGEQVMANQNVSNTTINTLDISSLTTGVYFVKVVSGSKEITSKVIVE